MLVRELLRLTSFQMDERWEMFELRIWWRVLSLLALSLGPGSGSG